MSLKERHITDPLGFGWAATPVCAAIYSVVLVVMFIQAMRRHQIAIDFEKPIEVLADPRLIERDKKWRKNLHSFAGLQFLQRCGQPRSRYLIARKWPHLLFNSWSVKVGGRVSGDKNPRQLRIIVSRSYRIVVLNLWGPFFMVSWRDSLIPDTTFK